MSNNLIPRREDLFHPIEQAFDSFFEGFFNSNPLSRVKANPGYPRMNVSEQNGEFTVTLSMAGLKAEDVSIELDSNNVLTVGGHMSEEHKSPEGATYYLRECAQSKFERKIQLPTHVKGNPEAVMKDGLLKLTWEVEEKKPEGIRKIAVKTEQK